MAKIIRPSRGMYSGSVVVNPLPVDHYHFQPRIIKIYDIVKEGEKPSREMQNDLEESLIRHMHESHKRMVSPGNLKLAFLINNLSTNPLEISLNGWDYDEKNRRIRLLRRSFTYNGQLGERRISRIGEHEIPVIEHERVAMQLYIQGESFETWLTDVYTGTIKVGHFARR